MDKHEHNHHHKNNKNEHIDHNKIAMNHETYDDHIHHHEEIHNHSHSESHQEAEHKSHEGHHDHHTMMVKDFKRRFLISLILLVPILTLSPMIQEFFDLNLRFSGDLYILLTLSTVLFI